MRLYAAGPMTGLPGFNYPAFNEAARLLGGHGYRVLNPARQGIHDDWQWSDYLRLALRDVTHSDGIALLDGWRQSRGALLEKRVAEALGMPVKSVDAWCYARADA